MNLSIGKKMSFIFFTLFTLSLLLYIQFAKASVDQAFTFSGTYIGDGSSDRMIAGLGFQPDVVMIKTGNSSAARTVIRTSAMGGTVEMASDLVLPPPSGQIPNAITGLNMDGFVVGNDIRVNENNTNYYWTAFKAAPGELVLGSYVGDGNDGHSINGLGFSPDYLIIIRNDGTTTPKQRSESMSWGHSFHSEAVNNTRITSLDNDTDPNNQGDGFMLGNSTGTNENDVAYSYIAWKNVEGRMMTGYYLGDGVTSRSIAGLGFQPELVWIIPEASNIASTWRPSSLVGDNTLSFNAFVSMSNQIKALNNFDGNNMPLNDGFTLGNHPRVNQNGTTYRWVAWAKNIPPTITFMTLPNAGVAIPYSQTLTATGGGGSYNGWTLNSGSLPSGLQIDSATGLIHGTTFVTGTFDFSVTMVDGNGTVSAPANFSLTVINGSPLTVTTASLPNATIYASYSQTLTATGGSGTYSNWAVNSGTLPSGFQLNSVTGVISGKTLITGVSNFSVVVTDSNGLASEPFALSITADTGLIDTFEGLTPVGGNYGSSVIILLDPNLLSSDLIGPFTTWVQDLENDSYKPIVKVSTFANPEEVRAYLTQQAMSVTPYVEGAILVGNIPYAHLVIDETSIPGGGIVSVPTYEFYQDLDGDFTKSDPNFPDAYSTHTGNTENEIWVSVLPFYSDATDTIQNIIHYLGKNHAYRTQGTAANSYIEIKDMSLVQTLDNYNFLINEMLHGAFSWIPSNSVFQSIDLFINNSVGQPGLTEGYTALAQPNKYAAFALNTHGDSFTAGWLSKAWFVNNSLNPLFAFLTGCSSGNPDAATPNVLSEIIYNSNSHALLAQGTTSLSGGLGTNVNGFYGNNLLRELFNGQNVGEVFREHLNAPLISPWDQLTEYEHALLVLDGDATLRFPIRSSETAVSTSKTPSILNENVTFTATVTGANPIPTGTVTFKDGGSILGTVALDSTGHAQYQTSVLTAATHPITVVYGGNAVYGSSTSPSVDQVVQKISSTTNLASSKNPTILNEVIAFTATVNGSASIPTGTVTFKDGGSILGTVALDAAGHAQYQTSVLTAATHPITALYNGNSIYNSSLSPSMNQTVNQKATPTISPIAYPSPSQLNKSATFYAVVSGTYGMPSGTVNYYDGATYLGVRTLNASGQAAFSISTLSAGSHSITIRYNGNATYDVVTSSPLIHLVQ